MTTRLVIRNDDHSAPLKVAQIDGPKDDPSKQCVALSTIPPGAEMVFYVYGNRQIVIEEKVFEADDKM